MPEGPQKQEKPTADRIERVREAIASLERLNADEKDEDAKKAREGEIAMAKRKLEALEPKANSKELRKGGRRNAGGTEAFADMERRVAERRGRDGALEAALQPEASTGTKEAMLDELTEPASGEELPPREKFKGKITGTREQRNALNEKLDKKGASQEREFDAADLKLQAKEALQDLKNDLEARGVSEKKARQVLKEAYLAERHIKKSLTGYTETRSSATRKLYEDSVRKRLAMLRGGITDDVYEKLQLTKTRRPAQRGTAEEIRQMHKRQMRAIRDPEIEKIPGVLERYRSVDVQADTGELDIPEIPPSESTVPDEPETFSEPPQVSAEEMTPNERRAQLKAMIEKFKEVTPGLRAQPEALAVPEEMRTPDAEILAPELVKTPPNQTERAMLESPALEGEYHVLNHPLSARAEEAISPERAKHFAERVEAARATISERRAILDTEAAEKGSWLGRNVRKMGERYNKIPLKYKFAIGGALILATGLTATPAMAALAPVAAKVFFGIGMGQRALGGAGMFVKFEKQLEDAQKGVATGWVTRRNWFRSVFSAETKGMRTYNATLMAAFYGASMAAGFQEAAHLISESSWGQEAGQKASEWMRAHWPGAHTPTGAPPTGAETHSAATTSPLMPGDLSETTPNFPSVEPHAPTQGLDALSHAASTVEAPPSVSEISVSATKGHGYEYMMKRLWEQLHDSSKHFSPPPNLDSNSDLARLLAADNQTIDKVVHDIASNPSHHFFNSDGTSIRVNPTDHMSIGADGQVRLNDVAQAPGNAPTTPAYHPEVAQTPASAETAAPTGQSGHEAVEQWKQHMAQKYPGYSAPGDTNPEIQTVAEDPVAHATPVVEAHSAAPVPEPPPTSQPPSALATEQAPSPASVPSSGAESAVAGHSASLPERLRSFFDGIGLRPDLHNLVADPNYPNVYTVTNAPQPYAVVYGTPDPNALLYYQNHRIPLYAHGPRGWYGYGHGGYDHNQPKTLLGKLFKGMINNAQRPGLVVLSERQLPWSGRRGW